MAKAILEGIRVIEFGYGAVMPDPMRIMGAFGADVVKVEGKEWYDWGRRPTAGTLNQAPGFNDGNRNKRGIGMNLKTPKGRELALELIKRSDIVAENLRPGALKSMGLDYDSVRRVKPDIIYLSSLGWGGGGPYAQYLAIGPHGPAASGLLYLWNYSDTDQLGAVGLHHSDHVAGKIGLVAVLAALDYRRRTGKGQRIECSHIEAAASFVGESYLDYTINNRLPLTLANRSLRAAPHGIYKCKGTVQHGDRLPPVEDRWVAISVFTDEEWLAFCKAIGSPPWTKSPKFATLLARKENEDELDRLVAEWTRTLDPWEATNILQGGGVAAFVVEDAEDHVLRDSHLKARGSIVEVDHPAAGKTLHISEPIKLSETIARATPAPMLDQHTDEVLREVLGLAEAEIRKLREQGAIGA